MGLDGTQPVTTNRTGDIDTSMVCGDVAATISACELAPYINAYRMESNVQTTPSRLHITVLHIVIVIIIQLYVQRGVLDPLV